jgi:hypothetical protein
MNVHAKMAMAEGLGCFLIAFIAIVIAMFGLDQYDSLVAVLGMAPYIGLGLLLCTYVSFVNENLICTAVFGLLGVFLLAFSGITSDPATMAGATAVGTIGVIILIIGVVALNQPVKILPILLFIAGLTVLVTALWWDSGDIMDSALRMVMGVLWLVTALLAFYIGTGVMFLVVKGKQVLPLLIKA